MRGASRNSSLSPRNSRASQRPRGKFIIYCKHGLDSIERSLELLRDPVKFIIYCRIHGLDSIERSPELLQYPGKLIIYCKIHGLDSIERSLELLRDPVKLIIYCRIHGLNSIERSPKLLQDPERLWNYGGVRATIFTRDFFSRNHRATYVLQFSQSWPCNWRSRQ